MAHSSLTPVFVGLRAGLHCLTGGLAVLVALRTLVEGGPMLGPALALLALFVAVYAAGSFVAASPAGRRGRWTAVWIVALCAVWACLVAVASVAAYLVFPLFFLFLHVLGPRTGPLAVICATGIAILVLAAHDGLTLGGVVGPLVGAGVALLIGLGYRALAQEAREREALLAELLATRDLLAATERQQGVLAERSRLAREIHDTVAQDLSSIQMLLHAAEASDGERPGIEHVRLARETAASGLADARRFIRELAPPDLERGLAPALERLARTTAQRTGIDVEVDADASLEVPVAVQVALLRIGQGALANVVQHAEAGRAAITLGREGGGTRLEIADDGRGFSPQMLEVASTAGGDSFGLRAMAERAAEIGGALEVDAEPGRGTRIRVRVPDAVGPTAPSPTSAVEAA